MTFAPDQISQGARLGKYEIIKSLAMGGMAELFLARAHGIEGFEKLVVIKRILPQFARDERFVSMFLDEARLAATLHHPNVAQVYDIGVVDQSYFFAMELVHGPTLLDLLRNDEWRGRGLPLAPAITVALGLVAALHYAHEKRGLDGNPLNIVHRDVSPSNVMVTYDGQVKLVDFGIAKATSQQAVTLAGTLKGKLPYMPPEQLACMPLDRRCDVYAVGVVFYEMTTGFRMFETENDLAMAKQITESDFLSPTARRADYPKALETIVLKALQAEPNNRYATARELQSDLEAFALDQRIIASPSTLSDYIEDVFGEKLSTSDIVFPADPEAGERTSVDPQTRGPASSPSHVILVAGTPSAVCPARPPATTRPWGRWAVASVACGLLLALVLRALPSPKREGVLMIPDYVRASQQATVSQASAQEQISDIDAMPDLVQDEPKERIARPREKKRSRRKYRSGAAEERHEQNDRLLPPPPQ